MYQVPSAEEDLNELNVLRGLGKVLDSKRE